MATTTNSKKSTRTTTTPKKMKKPASASKPEALVANATNPEAFALKREAISYAGVSRKSDAIGAVVNDLRERLVEPYPKKEAPRISSVRLREMLGIDKPRFNYLMSKGIYPEGAIGLTGNTRSFSLEETVKWLQLTERYPVSPLASGGPGLGKVISVVQQKGGCGKTTTAVNLAQGLTLLSRRVLLIDLDPQGSSSELLGVYAELAPALNNPDLTPEEREEILSNNQTYLAELNRIYAAESGVFEDSDEDAAGVGLENEIRPTYWHNLDVLPAASELSAAEYLIPAFVVNNRGYPFWADLRKSIDKIRHDYDYIVIDTSPSLSFLTMNALYAADGLIMPLVPDGLDFLASTGFWKLFSELTETIISYTGDDSALPVYDFINILFSKVDATRLSQEFVMSLASKAYGDWVSPVRIPNSSLLAQGVNSISTVFDIVSNTDVRKSALDKIRKPFEDLCESIDSQYYPDRVVIS